MGTPALKPKEVSDVELAFPGNALDFMPEMSELPEPFCDVSRQDDHPAMRLASRMMFGPAIPGGVEFHAVDGIDPEMAFRQIQMILGSFAPKHEHKMGTVAYMISIWFSKVIIPNEGGEDEILWQQPAST